MVSSEMTDGRVHISAEKRNPLVTNKATYASSYDDSLTLEELEKARVELHETTEKKYDCLQELKTRLSKDGTGKYLTDDDYLLRYLRFKKFNCDEAYKVIKNYYSIRRKHPEVFEIFPNLETLLNRNFFYFLPYADEQGRITFVCDAGQSHPGDVSFIESLGTMAVIADIITTNPKCQINGFVGIWDMKGFTTSHITSYMSPSNFMLFVSVLQNSCPWRVKLVIGFNCNRFTQTGYRIIRPFLKKKITDRIVLLGSDVNELHQYINPALLPKSLGGNLTKEECSITQHILNNLNYLQYERSFTSMSEN